MAQNQSTKSSKTLKLDMGMVLSLVGTEFLFLEIVDGCPRCPYFICPIEQQEKLCIWCIFSFFWPVWSDAVVFPV